MSATSVCACDVPCAGFIKLKIAPVTVSMMAADTAARSANSPLPIRGAVRYRAHDAFLVFTVTRSVSPGIRDAGFDVARRAASFAIGVTSTWITSVLFGFVGSGWIDHRRM